MGTKPKAAEASREHFAGEVRRWVEEEFAGNQTQAAKRLGVSQAHMSAIVLGVRGPGLSLLLLMREQTGRTIDDLLGLEPPQDPALRQAREAIEEQESAMKAAEARLAELRAQVEALSSRK